MLRCFKVALALWFCGIAPVKAAEPHLELMGIISAGAQGGLSSLELDATGVHGLTASDRGELFTVQLVRKSGKLVASQVSKRPTRDKTHGDLEGIATLPGGQFALSFEGTPSRVRILTPQDKIQKRPSHPDFGTWHVNRGFEALATDQEGRLLAIPEAAGGDKFSFPVYVLSNGAWSIAHRIPRLGPFHAVGADLGPDGLLYLLERTITPLGFRTQVRRFDLTAPDLAPQRLLRTWPSVHDNLEGISVWRDDQGHIRLTMVSDDNFLAIQRSEFVEYRIIE